MTRAIPFLDSPLILAPMAGPGSVTLTAAACNAGIFAFLASAYSDARQMRADIDSIRSSTHRPFGINLFIEAPLEPVAADALAAADGNLDRYRDELGIPRRATPPMPTQRYREQLAVVLAARPRAFSFTFGIPEADDMRALADAGIYTIGTATSVEEAIALERAGVDAVVAQGAEAGGHRGSFLDLQAPPLIGTMALVPQVVDAVRIPVIAAGGISDGRGVAAALALGASAVALGTAFLRAPEASTSPAYRRALAASSSADTTITRCIFRASRSRHRQSPHPGTRRSRIVRAVSVSKCAHA